MTATHVLLCYLASRGGDSVLGDGLGLAENLSARLTVVLPVVEVPLSRGCCGIQPAHWERLLEEDTRAAADRASKVLRGAGMVGEVSIVRGSSITNILSLCAARSGCDLIAVPAKAHPWSTGGLSRRIVRAVRRGTSCQVIELARAGQSALVSPKRS